LYYGKKQKQKRGSFTGFLIILIIVAGLLKLYAPSFWETASQKWKSFTQTGGFTDFKSSLTRFEDVKDFVCELKEALFGKKAEPEPVSTDAEPQAEPGQEPLSTLPVLSFKSYTVSQYTGFSAPAAADVSYRKQLQVSRAFSRSQQPYCARTMPQNTSAAYEGITLEHTDPLTGAVTCGFGYRIHPVTGTVSFHYGADLAAGEGDKVSAFSAGQVASVGSNSTYGNYVLLTHPEDITTYYAHLSTVLVEPGDSVEPGQTIALAGSTGLATGPHLHFEVRRNGVYLNPLYYLDSFYDYSA